MDDSVVHEAKEYSEFKKQLILGCRQVSNQLRMALNVDGVLIFVLDRDHVTGAGAASYDVEDPLISEVMNAVRATSKEKLDEFEEKLAAEKLGV